MRLIELRVCLPRRDESPSYPEQAGNKVGLYGRYVLTMQFDVALDRKAGTLTASGQPQFDLVEVESITALPDGRAEIRYGPTQKVFGPLEWRKLVENGGDLSVLGIEVKKEQPVAGFEAHWRKS